MQATIGGSFGLDSVPNAHGRVGKNMARSPEVADAVPALWVPSAWPARGRGAAHIKNQSKSGLVDPFLETLPGALVLAIDAMCSADLRGVERGMVGSSWEAAPLPS